MKYLTLFFLLFLSSITAFSQQRELFNHLGNFSQKDSRNFHNSKKNYFKDFKSQLSLARTSSTLVLDSVIEYYPTFQEIYKYVLTYDLTLNRATLLSFAIFNYVPGNTNWGLPGKAVADFDANGNLILKEESNRNLQTNQLIPYHKVRFGYNTNNDPTLRIDSLWNDTTNQYEPHMKMVRTYTAWGALSLIEYFTWDSNTNQWLTDRGNAKVVYAYLPNNKVGTINKYDWDAQANQWKDREKEVFEYDTNNYLAKYIDYSPDSINQWIGVSKSEYSNTNSGNIMVANYFNWDATTNDWKNTYQGNYIYGVNNLPLVIEYSQFNANVWDLYSKYDYDYDVNNNLIYWQASTWDNSNGIWRASSKGISQYNLTYHYSDVSMINVMFLIEGNPETGSLFSFGSNILIDQKRYRFTGGTWRFEGEFHYYYPISSASPISPAISENVRIYPNPSNGSLKVDIPFDEAELEVWTIQGEKVFSQSVNNGSQIALNDLAKGLYICRISAKAQTYNLKLVVE